MMLGSGIYSIYMPSTYLIVLFGRMKRDINVKYNLKEYWTYVKKHKWIFVLLIGLIILQEVSFIVDKHLFKVLIDSGEQFIDATLSGSIFIKIMTEVKQKYFNHILHLSHRFHTTHKTGSLISRLGRGGYAVERLTDVIIFNFTPLVIQLIVVGASLAYFSWIPAVVVAIICVVFVAFSFVMQQRQKHANVVLNEKEDTEKANVSDVFTNIDSIKYYGKESLIKKKFKKVSDETKWAMIRHWDYFVWMDIGQSFILSIGAFFLSNLLVGINIQIKSFKQLFPDVFSSNAVP